MDAITLYKEKEQIIRSILDADEETISRIAAVLKKTVKYPAQMTTEELRKEVMLGVDQVNMGQVISHDSFLKKHGI